MEQHTHTIVVGAGITGLAYCLMHGQTHVNKDRRPSLLLLEKEFEVGGRIRSFQQNLQSGQYIELGPARFNQDHTNLMKLLEYAGVPYQEYSTSPVITYKSPLTIPLLDTSNIPAKKNQILQSYPTLDEKQKRIHPSFK